MLAWERRAWERGGKLLDLARRRLRIGTPEASPALVLDLSAQGALTAGRFPEKRDLRSREQAGSRVGSGRKHQNMNLGVSCTPLLVWEGL